MYSVLNLYPFLHGVWIGRYFDHLHVVTTNNYSTVAISKIYNLLEHTVKCSQSVTRRFLVTAPSLAIPLSQAQDLSSQTLLQN
jgi:hypothetical protein